MKFEQLQKDMVVAMKAHDKSRKDSIATLISDVKKVAIDEGTRDNISEELVDRVIIKSLKTAKEQLDTCPDDRPELKSEYQLRYDVIKEYAPSMMSEEEVKKFLSDNFSEVISTKNKGQIMKEVMPALKGKADGKIINMIVAEMCK